MVISYQSEKKSGNGILLTITVEFEVKLHITDYFMFCTTLSDPKRLVGSWLMKQKLSILPETRITGKLKKVIGIQ